jgi:histidinol-phosphate aminotransferase
MTDLIRQWIRPEILQLSAYHVADASGLIKLDAMENPYTWPDELRSAWLARLQSVDVNRYPDPHASALMQRLRNYLDLPEHIALLPGNGSDEIIQLIAMALSGSGRSILSVEPSFVMYRMIATFCGMEYTGVPLKAEDYSLDMPALLQAVDETRPAAVFLAYPNNPTGNLFDEQDVIRLIEAAPGLVVIDEAYSAFAQHSFRQYMGQYDNLLLMGTLSKMGLAGLRLGFLAGPAAWLEQLDKVRLPYNINVLTQVSTDFALAHRDVFDAQTAAIREQREQMLSALLAMEGVHAFPSQANFILARLGVGQAEPVFNALKQSGLLVKLLHGSHPLLQDCLRLTIGTAEENARLLTALDKALV